jgi:hypothetical protein
MLFGEVSDHLTSVYVCAFSKRMASFPLTATWATPDAYMQGCFAVQLLVIWTELKTSILHAVLYRKDLIATFSSGAIDGFLNFNDT